MINDGLLSQEEIDALLNEGVEEINSSSEKKESGKENAESASLSPMELDALGEIGNISFGNSATALSSLLNQKVEITTPSVSLIEKRRLEEEFPKPYVAVVVDYTSGFFGSNLLIINQKDASIIADLMLGGDGQHPDENLDELKLSAVQEAMNQMMGSAATSMSSIFGKRVEISPPLIDILNIPKGEGVENLPKEEEIVKISFHLTVGDLINSQIMHLLPVRFAKQLVNDLLRESGKMAGEVSAGDDRPTGRGRDDMVEQSSVREKKRFEKPETEVPQTPVRRAVFEEFPSAEPPAGNPRNLQMLFDIPLNVTVELGRTSMTVKEILDLSTGSIIELDKLAGEPVDILINRQLVAKGEVVVIEENFGVRVTEIISQEERMKKMN